MSGYITNKTAGKSGRQRGAEYYSLSLRIFFLTEWYSFFLLWAYFFFTQGPFPAFDFP